MTTCCVCPYTEKELYERSKKTIDELVELDDNRCGRFKVGSSTPVWSEACSVVDRKMDRKFVLEHNPHRVCRPAYHGPWSYDNFDGTVNFDEGFGDDTGANCLGVPIQVLQACRQIYTEANPMFWATNTFSFRDPGEYRGFMEDRTSAQKATLTKLHLDMDWADRSYGHAWEMYGSSLAMIRGFRNLKSLSIHIDHGFPSAKMLMPHVWNRSLEALSRYRVLPLQSVQVVVMNAVETEDASPDESMTHQECVALAEEIREPLLDANGARKLEEAALAKRKAKICRMWSTEEDCARYRELVATRKVSKSGWSCGASHVCLICAGNVGYETAKLCERPGRCGVSETLNPSSKSEEK